MFGQDIPKQEITRLNALDCKTVGHQLRTDGKPDKTAKEWEVDFFYTLHD